MNTQRKQKRYRGSAGFTLVELMVVVSIIAILATTVGVFMINAFDDASQAKAQAEIRTLMTGLEMYRLKFKQYPDSLDALLNNAKGLKFLDQDRIPLDPWESQYVYTLTNPREYTIVSYGADKRQGGSGYDADISSNNLKGNE
ncbi:MAG TPA: type II secretion system protein GspG [Candidatus Hydrogenedentes bacterium]|nr:type II secretion system protein GspG [Candidatus Hydrogenedentota bacterium]